MFKVVYKLKNRKGFTLVELLIAVAIVGILAAIAIPQFDAYRRRAYNAAANSDLRNVRTAEEAMFAEYQDYGSSAIIPLSLSITLVGATSGASQTVVISSGVYTGAKVLESSGRNVTYTAAAKHTNGDSGFGTEAEIQGLYRNSFIPAGIYLQNSDIPAATTWIDFTSVNNWLAVQ